MGDIVKCANCDREIDLSLHANTSCNECNKIFCFSDCFPEYHRKNNLRSPHSALSITNPKWIMNLRNSVEKEKKDE